MDSNAIFGLVLTFVMAALDRIINTIEDVKRRERIGKALGRFYLFAGIALAVFLLLQKTIRFTSDPNNVIILPSFITFINVFAMPSSVAALYQKYLIISYAVVVLITMIITNVKFWKFFMMTLSILIICLQIVVFPSDLWKIIMFAVIMLAVWATTVFFLNRIRIRQGKVDPRPANSVRSLYVLLALGLIAFILNCFPETRLSLLEVNIRWLIFSVVMTICKYFITLDFRSKSENIPLGSFIVLSLDILVHLIYIDFNWGIIDIVKSIIGFMR